MSAALATQSWPLSQEAAAAALLKRRQARTSFTAYIDYLDVGLVPAAHHALIIETLEAVERGDIDRAMFLLPPGSAKSTYSTVLFSPWYMGRNPGSAVICCSNTTTLAEHFSRRSRNIVDSAAHQAVFGDGLAKDSSAAGSWETGNGSSCLAAGVGATITGRRGDLGLIDDPVKSREEADSETQREKHWNWYVNDFVTRLKPKAKRILIQTRWHEDDLAGRILQREEKRWRVIKLPMLAGQNDLLGRAPGERLWPEYFTEEMVAEARLNPRAWSALYQQEPSPEDGTFFQRAWFWFYDPKEAKGRKYLSSDFAFTENGGDFTEIGIHSVWQEHNETKLYLCVDGWYGQQDQVNWAESYMDLVARHRPIVEFGEGGMTRRASEGLLGRVRRERRAPGGKIEWMPSISDKVARAAPLRAMASMGRVGLPDNDYGHRVLAQLLGFPAGKHDDAVDMVGMMARAIDQAHPAMALTATRKVVTDKWDRAFDSDEGSSWRL